jgi:hypothetical protein
MECELKALAREKAASTIIQRHLAEFESCYAQYLQQFKKKGEADVLLDKKR